MNSRRDFLIMLTAAMLAPSMTAKSKLSRLPLAFSTLGCPAWEWKKILEFAAQHGFSAIELRGLEGKLDLPAHPIFAADRMEQTRKEIRSSNLQIACVSSSAQLYVEDPAKRAKELADARRFIDLAATLKAPYVRVFGGKAESDKSPMPDHETQEHSIGSGEDRKYVLTGRGNIPIERQIEALRSIGYKGFYCFEWEKLWHPDIDDPEIAIADFAHVVGQCSGNARACGLM